MERFVFSSAQRDVLELMFSQIVVTGEDLVPESQVQVQTAGERESDGRTEST